MRLLIALPLCSAILTSCAGEESRDAGTESAYREAYDLVRRAADAFPAARILSSGVIIEGEGEYDLSARLQGLRPDEPQRVPLAERLAVSSRGVIYESRSSANADAAEHLRYVFDREGRMLFLDLINYRSFWDTDAAVADHRRGYERVVPHLVLRDALEQRETLRVIGPAGELGTPVGVTLASGRALTLFIDETSSELRAVEYLLDMPMLGDAVVRWRYDAYAPFGEIGRYPSGHTVELAARLMRRLRYTRVAAGVEPRLFEPPPEIAVRPPPPVQHATADAAAAESPAAQPGQPGAAASPAPAAPIAENVYLARNVRPGFHHLVVEFPSYILVVDAPAGWYELQQLPAVNWVAGATSSSAGRRLVAMVHATVPNKPIRYVALTHHHGDHAGGVRALAAAGATVLASETTAGAVRDAFDRSFTLVPDGWMRGDPAPIEVVEGERIVREGDMEVRIVDVGENPHADGMLAVWLPAQRILYVSDLWEPLPDRIFPTRERTPIMEWFIGWLDRSGLDPAMIYAVHGSGLVTEAQLERIRAGMAGPNEGDAGS